MDNPITPKKISPIAPLDAARLRSLSISLLCPMKLMRGKSESRLRSRRVLINVRPLVVLSSQATAVVGEM